MESQPAKDKNPDEIRGQTDMGMYSLSSIWEDR
jgi:hypothetical protein